VVQTSGGAPTNNFTAPQTYRVTAADATFVDYVVTVTIAPNSAKAITAYSFVGFGGFAGTINELAKTIAVTLPSGTAVTALTANFTTTGTVVRIGAAVQTSGGAPANDFTGPVAYTVTAADATTATYTVTVTVSAVSLPLPKTGQTTCYDTAGTVIACAGTGQDGALLKGVAWPVPRFIDNADGTVTDNLTGLIWLKNASCFATQWAAALTSANTLASGSCGLTDGSTASQWRLPNRKELLSLVDRSKFSPALPTGHPFTSVQTGGHWSASTYSGVTSDAWVLDMFDGYVYSFGKTTGINYVWPVKGGL
jgi:hypothetical protein